METSNLPTFRARHFATGLPPAGVTVSVQVRPDGLWIARADGVEQLVPYAVIEIQQAGFDQESLLFVWPDGSLSLTEPSACYAFLQHVPSELAPQVSRVRQAQARAHRRTRIGWAVIVLIVLLPLLVATGLWLQSDRLIDWAVGHVSVETERKLGDLVYQQVSLGQTPAPEFQKTIREIGERLSHGAPYPFQWHVVSNPQVNAFAVPGGHVVVFTGLIQAADSAEEVAGVLAHEVQHVVQRHSLRAMTHDLGWQATLSLLFGSLGGGAVDKTARQLGGLRFGRGQERAADIAGLAALKQAGIDPQGMIAFFEKLARNEVRVPLLSTHPASDDRAAALKEEIERIGPWKHRPLPYDWQAIRNQDL